MLKFLKSHDDFHRYFSRSLLFTALLGLAIQCKFSGIRSWTEVGWCSFKGNGLGLTLGVLLGIASLGSLVCLAFIFDVREFITPQHSFAEWARHLRNALATAALVAIIEETLFRGMFFGLLRRDFAWRRAAVVSSLIYSAAHFLPESTRNPFLLSHFLNLFFAGLILAGVYTRTGNLYFSIGIHAGWIVCLKTADFISINVLPAPSLLWGPGWLLKGQGWVATPLLGLMVWYIFRGGDPEFEKPSS